MTTYYAYCTIMCNEDELRDMARAGDGDSMVIDTRLFPTLDEAKAAALDEANTVRREWNEAEEGQPDVEDREIFEMFTLADFTAMTAEEPEHCTWQLVDDDLDYIYRIFKMSTSLVKVECVHALAD